MQCAFKLSFNFHFHFNFPIHFQFQSRDVLARFGPFPTSLFTCNNLSTIDAIQFDFAFNLATINQIVQQHLRAAHSFIRRPNCILFGAHAPHDKNLPNAHATSVAAPAPDIGRHPPTSTPPPPPPPPSLPPQPVNPAWRRASQSGRRLVTWSIELTLGSGWLMPAARGRSLQNAARIDFTFVCQKLNKLSIAA